MPGADNPYRDIQRDGIKDAKDSELDQVGSDAWMKDPDQIERLFLACVANADVEGVDGCLRLMLAADPKRGIALYNGLKTALKTADLLQVINGDASEETIARLLA